MKRDTGEPDDVRTDADGYSVETYRDNGKARKRLSEYDFRCHMPSGRFIYLENGDLWPASSVNKRVPPILVGNNEKGDPVYVTASNWIGEHLPVEQMTWYPGLPQIVHDRLMLQGGLVDKQGATLFNLYRPPPILPGDPRKARRWLKHVFRLYPTDFKHIIRWLAHIVQKPQEKINHALVMIGEQGIGKDTILYPVIAAIGSWNFMAISPTVLLGRFNGYLKNTLVQINEGRDLGEVNRYAFYEHCKPILAAPPDCHLVDEKNRQEYLVPNLCNVAIGSNYKTDGLYLPEDDRRHYVAASERLRTEFTKRYFDDLYRWFDREGSGHVAAYLRQVDLSRFDAKAPPPKTAAFFEIVEAEKSPHQSRLAEILAEMESPDAVTIRIVIARIPMGDPFEAWLTDPKNRRQIPAYFERAGYVRVQNPNATDHLWAIEGKRVVVYGRRNLPQRQRIEAAMKL